MPDCRETTLGLEYRGIKRTTQSGLTCQRWDSQTPHQHARTKESYPHLGLDENFCRNPDYESVGPWCYTTSMSVRFEGCNVIMCSDSKYFKKIKSTINFKLIEESQNDEYKKYSIFDDVQDGSKQKSVSFMVYDSAF